MSILVSNIQRMSLSDGPGIRTTVFLMGCSLRCPWCSNPENLDRKKSYYFREDKCIGKRIKCPFETNCGINDRGFELTSLSEIKCPINAVGQYGREYSEEELLQDILRDREFWGTDGGVTFSGGEALLWAKELEPVLVGLKKSGVSVAVESALFVPMELLEIFKKYIDYFYIDVKILDKKKCFDILGGNLDLFLKNIDGLTKTKSNIVFRVPCSDKYTLNDENMVELLDFFKKNKEYSIEIFPVHTMGNEKYLALGLNAPEKLSSDNISEFKRLLQEQGNSFVELKL